MQITIKYQYQDRRKHGVGYVTGQFTVDVVEVMDVQAPILMYSRLNFGKQRHPGTPQSVALRTYGGRIWSPGPVIDGVPMPTDRAWRYITPRSVCIQGVLGERVALPHIESLHVARDKESIEHAVREWADDCLVIDGQLHRPTLQPQYVVRCYADRTEIDLTSAGMPIDDQERSFAATELDAAREHAKSMSNMGTQTFPPELMPIYVLDVRRPDLLCQRTP